MLKRLQDVPPFEVAEGSPDVRGWDVVDRNHRKLAKVDSLIIDEDDQGSEGLTPVRYLGIQSDGSVKMVPIGVVTVDETAHEVVLTREEDARLERLPTFQELFTPERDGGSSRPSSPASATSITGSRSSSTARSASSSSRRS